MIKFKEPSVRREFYSPVTADPRLVGMTIAFALYVDVRFGKDVIVTDVARYDGRLDSPHRISGTNPRSRAVDIRLRDPSTGENVYTEDELAEMLAWLELNFPRSDQKVLEKNIPGWQGPARVHGPVLHLHLTVQELGAFRDALFGGKG